MRFSRALISASAVIFAGIGLAYFIAPGPMLSIVGIPSNSTNDFLMRTEGVALGSAAIFLWAARGGSSATVTIALSGLATYYIVGSVVDLAAFTDGVVGAASVPSGVIRIGFGLLCIWAAFGLRQS
jgi:putative effector of murein hydrolase